MPPLNLVGDFGGGGMLLAFGIACGAARGAARRARARSSTPRWSTAPRCSTTMFSGMRAAGQLERRARREPARRRRAVLRHLRDAPTASTSRSARSSRSSTPSCSSGSASTGDDLPQQHDRAGWPALRERFAAALQAEARATSGARCFEGTDACFAPVLTLRRGAPRIRTTRRAAASIERRRHRPAGAGAALRAARRARSRGRRPSAAKAARRRSPTGASTPRGDRASSAGCGVGCDRRRLRAADATVSSAAPRSAHSPSRSAATPSSRSFSRCAVSERSAIGVQPRPARRHRRSQQRLDRSPAPSARSAVSTLASRFSRCAIDAPRIARRGSAIRKPWPGASQSRSQREQRAQRREVGAHVAVGRVDDDGRALHHVVAGEERLLFLEQVAEVIRRVARACGSRAASMPSAERDPLAAVQQHGRARSSRPAIRDARGAGRWTIGAGRAP